MPQEPKKRHSRQRQGKRRARIRLSLAEFVLCQECKKPILPHTVCKYCGFYGGKRIFLKKETTKEEPKKSGEDKTSLHEKEGRPKT